MRAVVVLMLACVGACTSSHGGVDGGADADPILFGDVHASRTYYSLTDEDVLAMCEYLYERGGFGAYPDDALPCPSHPDGAWRSNVLSCTTGYVREVLDPRCPSVGDFVRCQALRVADCNAGYESLSLETEEVCGRIPTVACTRDL
jgi:hypothetical protein